MVEVAELPVVTDVPTAPDAPRRPLKRPKMTKASVEAAKPEATRYDLKDHQVTGLRLTVFPSGVKTWSLRYTVPAKGGFADRRYTIGNFPTVGLDDARKAADAEKRKVVLNKADPAAEKAEARRKAAAGVVEGALFDSVWRKWQAAPKPDSRNGKGWRPSTARRTEKEFTNRLEPVWGKRRLDEITKADVSSLIDGVAINYAQAAARLRAMLASFFNWCVATGRIDRSPCDGIMTAKRNKRRRKLTDSEIRWLWLACDEVPFPFGHICRLLLLTVARRNEVAGMRREELHVGNQLKWILPPARTKNNREFEIVITPAMLTIIKSIPNLKNEAGFVFTTNGKTAFSGFSKAKRQLDAAMLEIARAEDPDLIAIPNWTLHDIRRSGATRIQRLADAETADACINHIEDDEYLQDGYEDKKIKAFQDWSREIARIVAGSHA